jgi:1L-myo-inositol 1-phosphate cytidylyltransferase
LCLVADRALIDWAIEGLVRAGVRRVIVVVGYRGETIRRHLAARKWPLTIETVDVDHRHPNGVSVLAGAALLSPGEEALLAMCDHLVDPELYARVASCGARDGLTLAVDRRLGHPWIDPDDVAAVSTTGERIVAIGKGLLQFDAYDTGVFAIGPWLVAALASLSKP